jgi:hypothetical protein
MRGPVRSFVRDHAAELVDWYAGNDPAKRTPQWFDRQWRSLTTYYGEDYGHWGDESNLVLLSELCFNAPPQTKSAAKPARHRPAGKGFVAKSTPRRAAPAFAPVGVPYGEELVRGGGQSGPVIVAVSDQNAAE